MTSVLDPTSEKILSKLKKSSVIPSPPSHLQLRPDTRDTIRKLKNPTRRRAVQNKDSKISETTLRELDIIDGAKNSRLKKSASVGAKVSSTTERTLSLLVAHPKKQKAKSKSELSPVALTILDLLKKHNSSNRKQPIQSLKVETEEMLGELSRADRQSFIKELPKDKVQKDIIHGVKWEKIRKAMKSHKMTMAALAAGDDNKLTDQFLLHVLPAMCLYDAEAIQDMVTSDTRNFLAKTMLDRILTSKNLEPVLEKISTLIQHIDPTDADMPILLTKTFAHGQWFSIFHMFKNSFPYIEDDQKTVLAETLKNHMDIKNDYMNYLRAARELRFNPQQLAVIDGSGVLAGGSFEKVKSFEGKVEEYYNTKSVAVVVAKFAATAAATVAATALATGSAVTTGGISLLLTLRGIEMLGFKSDSLSLDEYQKQKMICETLFRSANERGENYHTDDYKPINPIILAARIDQQQKLSLEAEQHAEETERWWQTAIHTPLTIENGVAALLDAGKQGTFEAWGTWIDSKIGTAGEKMEIKVIKDKIESLNNYLKPIKDDLEKYERMATENLYRCKYLQAQISCCLQFHPGEFGLSINVEKANETLEKLASYKKILEHLFELSETRLKIAQFKESVHYKQLNTLLGQIRIIAASVAGHPPPPAAPTRPTTTQTSRTAPTARPKAPTVRPKAPTVRPKAPEEKEEEEFDVNSLVDTKKSQLTYSEFQSEVTGKFGKAQQGTVKKGQAARSAAWKAYKEAYAKAKGINS